jgi:DNA-binding NarL/FixJ family response regulator
LRKYFLQIIRKQYKILSEREYEVFIDLAKGLKPAQIAQKYEIKSKTVSTYRNRIFEKMSFKSNADLVKYAIKNNLV